MKLLNGKELATKIKEELKEEIARMNANGQPIRLAVIQVGHNAASDTYVRNKQNACRYVGISSTTFQYGDISEDKLIHTIEVLNKDKTVNGILVQLPLPDYLDEHKVIQSIASEKDVDGFNAINVGKLTIGEEALEPCTAKGIIELLQANNIKIEGQHCVVVGRSNIVGKPTALELLNHNATVTLCHSKTKDLATICKQADILICAVGKPNFFNRNHIKDNAVVIDVGIHRQDDGSLCGDVDFNDVKDIVSAITPVPNGVGAMTVAMLMKNCVQSALMQYKK